MIDHYGKIKSPDYSSYWWKHSVDEALRNTMGISGANKEKV